MTNPTIETMVQRVGLRLGLSITSAPVGSSDLQLQQLVELFNVEVAELGTKWRWQELMYEASFLTTAAEDQGELDGSIVQAASLFNYIVSDTMWDRDARQAILGPKTAMDWQARKYLGYTTGPFPTYRLRNNHVFFLPYPTAGHTVFFEYMTKRYVYNEDANIYRTTFTDNDDTPVLDSDIIMLGVEWRWKKAKGFPYADEKAAWNEAATTKSGRGAGNERLSFGGGNSAPARGASYRSSSL